MKVIRAKKKQMKLMEIETLRWSIMLSLAGLAVVVVGVCIAIGTPILVSIFFEDVGSTVEEWMPAWIIGVTIFTVEIAKHIG